MSEPVEEPVRLVPKLVLELEDDDGDLHQEEFLAHERPNQWAIMENAKARKGTQSDQAAALHSLAMTSIKPEPILNERGDETGFTEQDRFRDWMMVHGRDVMVYDKIWDALNRLWAGESRLPLAPTSSDSGASTGTTEPSTTDSFSEPVSEPSTEGTGWTPPGTGPVVEEESGSSSPALISIP